MEKKKDDDKFGLSSSFDHDTKEIRRWQTCFLQAQQKKDTSKKTLKEKCTYIPTNMIGFVLQQQSFQQWSF
jgi:hypothetical protein